jgi:hypothetical protein
MAVTRFVVVVVSIRNGSSITSAIDTLMAMCHVTEILKSQRPNVSAILVLYFHISVTFMTKSPMPQVTQGTGWPRKAIVTNKAESSAEATTVDASGDTHHARWRRAWNIRTSSS